MLRKPPSLCEKNKASAFEAWFGKKHETQTSQGSPYVQALRLLDSLARTRGVKQEATRTAATAPTAAAIGESKKTGSRIQGYSGSTCRNGTSTEAIRLSAAASLPAAGGIGTDFLFRGRCLDRADPLSSEKHKPELVLRRSHGHPGIIKKVFAIRKV